jgi:hypothetical protein
MASRLTGLIGLCLLFAGAAYQWPLYSENQHGYFLTGLANAGFGGLSADWRARCVDIIPVFSALVTVIHLYGAGWMYYAIHAALLVTYAASLSGLVTAVFPDAGRPLPRLLVIASLTAVYSFWMLNLIKMHSSTLAPIVTAVQQLAAASISGVALQETPGPFLQPSAFGILFLTAIVLFARRREYAATACVAAAATLHSSLILQAAFITSAFMAVLWREGRLDRAWRVGALGAILVLPITIYIGYWLVASDPPDVRALSQRISVTVRQPHHAQPAVWFNVFTVVQLLILAAGLWLARRNTRVFGVMGICAAWALGLTLAQIATGSDSLAVMFPWRASVWLVPAATLLCVGQAAVLVRPRSERVLTAAVMTLMVFACLAGVWKTVSLAHAREIRDRGTMYEYVMQRASADQNYLIPTHDAHFRLSTGAPVFIDWKEFPYRASEIIEWDIRVRLVRAFYAATTPSEASEALAKITARAPITHVVIEQGHDPMRDIAGAKVVFEDSRFRVYELVR